jgi:GAF domain-containing protein
LTEAIDGVLHLTADLARRLAVPLLGQNGRNYGLLQISDKDDDQDFTEEDETQLTRLAQLTAKTLDAIHRMHRE